MKLKTLVMLGVTSLPLSAVADTVIINGFTFEPAENVSVSSPAYNGPAGQFTGTIDSGSGAQPFTTYCAEITETLNFGVPTEYTVVDGATAWGADTAELLGKWLTYAASFGEPDNALSSAIVQAIIWEFIYENPLNGYNARTGDFIVTAPFIFDYDLVVLLANVVSIYDVDLLSNVGEPGKQDLILIRRVPEPATLALLGLGLLGMGLRARRRMR